MRHAILLRPSVMIKIPSSFKGAFQLKKRSKLTICPTEGTLPNDKKYCCSVSFSLFQRATN